MADIEKLKQEELVSLQEEVNLEELILLGEDTKIPITITYPRSNGLNVKAKALVKQLTLKELDNIKLNKNDTALQVSKIVLQKSLFKQNGEPFTSTELDALPIGVVNAISNKVLELSGVDFADKKLMDF